MAIFSLRHIVLLIITTSSISSQTYCMLSSIGVDKIDVDKIMEVLAFIGNGYTAKLNRKSPTQIMQHYEPAKEMIMSWPHDERIRLINTKTSIFKWTMLHNAIMLQAPLDFIKFLINQGSNVNIPEGLENHTAIMFTASKLQELESLQPSPSPEITHYYTEIFQYFASLPETNINTYITDPLEDSLLVKAINSNIPMIIISLFWRHDLIIPTELIFKYISEKKLNIVRLITHTNLIKSPMPYTPLSHPQIDLEHTEHHKIIFSSNPLHTFASIGNHKLINRAYQQNPQWAVELDQEDGGNTPLHITIINAEHIENKHLPILKESYLKTMEALLSCNPLLAHIKNNDGLTPIQLAERCNISNEFTAILAKTNPLSFTEITEAQMRQNIIDSYEQKMIMFTKEISDDKRAQIKNTERRIAKKRHEHEQALIEEQRQIKQEEIAGRQAVKIDVIKKQLTLLEPCEQLRREITETQESLSLQQLHNLEQDTRVQALDKSFTSLIEHEASTRKVTEIDEGRAIRPIAKDHTTQQTTFLETLRAQEESRQKAIVQAEEARIATVRKAANQARLAEQRKHEEASAERIRQEAVNQARLAEQAEHLRQKQEEQRREQEQRAQEVALAEKRRQEQEAYHPLYAAIDREDINSIRKLTASNRSLINKRFEHNSEIFTPLKLAIFLENVEIVKTLVKAGAIVNPEGTFRSPIFEYASDLYHHRNIQNSTEKVKREEILTFLRFKILRLSPKK